MPIITESGYYYENRGYYYGERNNTNSVGSLVGVGVEKKKTPIITLLRKINIYRGLGGFFVCCLSCI